MAQEGTGDSAVARTYSRSISQYKAYSKCGQRFWLERFLRKQLPNRPAPWTILGIAFHDAVMHWEKGLRLHPILSYFSNIWDDEVKAAWAKQPDPELWYLPPRARNVGKSLENYYERGANMAATYQARCEDAPWEISHIEEQFELELGEITVRGAIDRVLYFPGEDEYVIEDLKSGAVDDWEWDYRQLAFYAFVAREILGIPVNVGRYWFTKVDRASEEKDLSKFDKKFWTEEFAKLDVGIDQKIFLANPGSHCITCAVRPWCNVQGWLEIGEQLHE